MDDLKKLKQILINDIAGTQAQLKEVDDYDETAEIEGTVIGLKVALYEVQQFIDKKEPTAIDSNKANKK